jgi:hypothetical protein
VAYSPHALQPMASNVVEHQILPFLTSLDDVDRHGSATLLYDEGWLLPLVLAAETGGIRCLPHSFGSRVRQVFGSGGPRSHPTRRRNGILTTLPARQAAHRPDR